ncbi:Retrotransposon protein [Phytophthora megakarya]|uniref:Retrotransposon protein n=1 Tax=Phytophthora megakarya TaxID=4795 RepID=A0A225WFS5_9STRA|nr:Retrotransposon protein [Phytophthora megakarya]
MGSGTKRDRVVVCAYTDADYAADKQTRKSVSVPGWFVKQQSTVALSTAEAEFVAAAMGVREVLRIKNLIEEIGFQIKIPMKLMLDNQAAINQVENEATRSMAKHVDVKFKFVRDVNSNGIITPVYVETKNQLADMFTKRLVAPRLAELCEKVGVH